MENILHNAHDRWQKAETTKSGRRRVHELVQADVSVPIDEGDSAAIDRGNPQCEPDSRGPEITHEGSVGELHLREYYK